MLKDLLVYVAKALVNNPDKVSADETEKDGITYLTLRVDADDMGMVIGRRGRIAKEIRTLIKAAGSKAGKRVMVEIAD